MTVTIQEHIWITMSDGARLVLACFCLVKRMGHRYQQF